MDIAMKNVSSSATKIDLEELLATHLHHPAFLGGGRATTPFNFNVHLPMSKPPMQRHSGTAFLTLPTRDLGDRFLRLYGQTGLSLKRKTIWFSRSNKFPDGEPVALQSIRRMPYVNPRVLEDAQTKSARLANGRIAVEAIQFGWDCRDQVLSIESEASPSDCYLSFDEERRQFRLEYIHNNHKVFIAVRFSQIDYLTAHNYLRREPVILTTLLEPPTFETELGPSQSPDDTAQSLPALLGSLLFDQQTTGLRAGPSRKQLSYLPLPENHSRVVPYASLALRLVLRSKDDLEKFRELSNLSGFRYVSSDSYRIDRRALFSQHALDEYSQWIRQLPWSVAFQVEAIVRKRSVDIREILDILPDIKCLKDRKGKKHAAMLLQDFSSKVWMLYRSEESDDHLPNAVRVCFERAVEEFDLKPRRRDVTPTDGSLFEAFHVCVTPTTTMLDGPNPERSNRVIRTYGEENQESFLRVTFTEEGRLQLRFDKEVDSREYLDSRVRPIFFNGLTIAGRKFEFLAYSQSALKEHTVWFVKPFKFKGEWVRARDIIASIGSFDDLDFDPNLARCPARYAARISQAFTATDASISVDVEEVFFAPDIEKVVGKGLKYVFTDGVGTVSLEVAEDIWRKLKGTRRRLRSLTQCPAAFQIRFQGSKGMVSVDHTLQGRAIVLRQSMIKFEAPSENNIEIARAFDRPTPYFLNRPLVMLLEGLGVKYAVFKKFQDIAVKKTEEAVEDLGKAGDLLQCHGLGSSFRLPSIMNSLVKLGITTLVGDRFYDKALEFAKNHILRLIKHHARIPIPGAWTLVGVADIHKYLQPGEIFACVKPPDGPATYLEGPVVISRSPTIHPGDVQVAHAIGTPPPGSCFEREPLANTVVFSVLGGGDLDGDTYNIIPLIHPELEDFEPQTTFEPAKYPPAEKKLLDRKCTMKDVAEFVMDYMISDVLGIVAINWLIIADQSNAGIEDPDCILLANLHSDAVDYPKSGKAVNREDIPRLKKKSRPDWNAPETVEAQEDTRKYYRSDRAIGRLFRAIDLPSDNRPFQGATRVSTRMDQSSEGRNVTPTVFTSDSIYTVIKLQVQRHVATNEVAENLFQMEAEKLFARYVTDLQGICITKTLSSARNASLTEEEAIIGTIVQKTSQPRRRKDMISRLRESTDILVRGVREQLEGDDRDTDEDVLERAWFAWEVALNKERQFGAQSFGWVALGAIFEAIRKIEERGIGRRIRS
ncbi:hypothetical protein D9611_003329 [Ephemerocybe angulata]|uniref:RNA-dependent RNA polymerase n=1 Tax=Ephemerocybe angulata TaxID=980116 RepID=A0A8H5CAA5_9AGAR|nr:hypothetical protein D9611_003329 [Tulosesus angulatus]